MRVERKAHRLQAAVARAAARTAIALAILAGASGAANAQRESGIQLSPDSQRYLISKDVGQERWAITYNLDDKTVTGNVFPLDGGNPSFLACVITSDVAAETYDLSCQFAQPCPSAPCVNQWGAPFPVPGIPKSFFLPTNTLSTFATNVQPIFNASCATSIACHAAGNANQLDLSNGVAYFNTFDRLSTQDPNKDYVSAFASDVSYLMNKIDGTGFGSRMPLGGPFLPAETADLIRQWILEGAANN